MSSTHEIKPNASSTEMASSILAPKHARALWSRVPLRIRSWFETPDFSIFFIAFMLFVVALYFRKPSGVGGGFVYDEQEAILANPYVRGQQPWLDAFKRDFWGRLSTQTIASYRPIPNLIWRALWRIQEWRASANASPVNTPFVWFNVVFHATNATLLSLIVHRISNRVSLAWWAGSIFAACAILTEAVSGIVGIADILGGTSLLLGLASLTLPLVLVAPLVCITTLFGLLSKESAIVNIGLIPLAALVFSPSFVHESKQNTSGYRWLRTSFAFVGAVGALALYFCIRHHTFHLELPLNQELAHRGTIGRWLAWLEKYVGAPKIPSDTFNNPLADPNATPALRIAGALRVYARGLGQWFFPKNLSPDYSTPQEPLPTQILFPESILGCFLMIAPPMLGLFIVLKNWKNRLESIPSIRIQRLAGYGLIAWPAAFFPLSNIPKLLPTVRAERFWYIPSLAIATLLAILLLLFARKAWLVATMIGTTFVLGQAFAARRHTNHFSDDLVFWEAAAKATPNSAKSRLNYSVMLGARAKELRGLTPQQAQEARLVENIKATELAPFWDMAHVYVGDALCQLNRIDEAWTWYAKGFRLNPGNFSLIALALQCLSDHNALLRLESQALVLADDPKHAHSWLSYLVHDTVNRERKCRAAQSPQSNPITLGSTTESIVESESTTPSVSTSTSTKNLDSTPHIEQLPIAKPSPPPPCGVDPKYRPRGLDGGPKAD